MPLPVKTARHKRETLIYVSERMNELLDEISEELITQRWNALTKEINALLNAYRKLEPIFDAVIQEHHQDKAFDFREFCDGLQKLEGYLEDEY